MNKDKIVTYIFFVLLAITGVWDWMARNGEKLWRIGLIYITIIIAYIIFQKTFLKKYKDTYLIVLTFVFMSMYLANVWDFYAIEYYDKFLHFTSGILIGFLGIIFYIEIFDYHNNKKTRYSAVTIFTFIFAVAVAGLWEIWEFTTDQLFNLTAQNNDLHDTMWDIICGTTGGSITCVLVYLCEKGKKIKFVKNIIS